MIVKIAAGRKGRPNLTILIIIVKLIFLIENRLINNVHAEISIIIEGITFPKRTPSIPKLQTLTR